MNMNHPEVYLPHLKVDFKAPKYACSQRSCTWLHLRAFLEIVSKEGGWIPFSDPLPLTKNITNIPRTLPMDKSVLFNLTLLDIFKK